MWELLDCKHHIAATRNNERSDGGTIELIEGLNNPIDLEFNCIPSAHVNAVLFHMVFGVC